MAGLAELVPVFAIVDRMVGLARLRLETGQRLAGWAQVEPLEVLARAGLTEMIEVGSFVVVTVELAGLEDSCGPLLLC